jgi:hypothetical protein
LPSIADPAHPRNRYRRALCPFWSRTTKQPSNSSTDQGGKRLHQRLGRMYAGRGPLLFKRVARLTSLSSSCVPRRNRSTRLDTAGKRRDTVRSNHTGNTAVMRLRSRRRRRLRPRLQLRPKTDQGPSAPTTHSRGSTWPKPSPR